MHIVIGVLAKDEERAIRKTGRQWPRFCDQVILLDGGSSDGTVAEALSIGGSIEVRSWQNGPDLSVGYNKLLRRAAEVAPEGVFLQVDADERIEGDPAAWREYLEGVEQRTGDGPCMLRFTFEGAGLDPSGGSYRVRGWKRPERWEYHHAIDCAVLPKGLVVGSCMVYHVPREVLRFVHLRTSTRKTSQERRRAAGAPLDSYGWSPGSGGRCALSLCTIFRRVDASLLRMLQSVGDHVDEIVLLKTGGEVTDADRAGVDAALEDLSMLPDLVLEAYSCPDEFEIPGTDGERSIGDFAAARNRCYSLASGAWRIYLDSDDELVWLGTGKAPRLAEKILELAEKTPINCIGLAYEYQSGSVPGVPIIRHDRVAIHKWLDVDGNELWKWDLPIHEMCEPTAYNTGIGCMNTKGGEGSDVFSIRHHVEESKHRSARNREITRRAIESGALSGVKAGRLSYYRAGYLLEDDPQSAEGLQLALSVARGSASESHGLLAGLLAVRTLRALRRFDEAVDVGLFAAEAWPRDAAVHVELMRAFREQRRPDLALKHAITAFCNPGQPGAHFEYRAEPAGVEIGGRFEAAELALEGQQYDIASEILAGLPEGARREERGAALIGRTERLRGDAEAAMCLERLVVYLLSIDRPIDAEEVLSRCPPHLRRQRAYRRALFLVNRRLDHFHRGVSREAYDGFNEQDLVVGLRPHQEVVFNRIVALPEPPDVFVDVGCNSGGLLFAVAQQFPGCFCVGLEAGERRAGVGRERVEAACLDRRVKIVCGLANDAGFMEVVRRIEEFIGAGNRPRQLIAVATEVLEHVEDPEQALAWLAQGLGASRVFVTVPDVEVYERLSAKARLPGVLPRDVDGGVSEGKEHVRCFDGHQLVRLLGSAGTPPERLERIGRYRHLLLAEGVKPKLTQTVEGPPLVLDFHCEGHIEWGPQAHRTGHVGGSEQAVIHLAPLLYGVGGYRVEVYAAKMERLEFERGVWWTPCSEFDPMARRDALVVWRRADLLNGARIAAKGGRFPVFLWAHDVPRADLAEQFKLATEVWTVSEYHRQLFIYLGCDPDRVRVIRNGIVPEAITAARAVATPRSSHRFIYCSSMDRGLLHLLRMWPRIREDVGDDAELHVCYRSDLMRFPGLLPVWGRVADECQRLCASLSGVFHHDGIPHHELLELLWSCGAWLYPTTFDEVSCIVAMEAQACGCIPVSTNRAALAETILDHEFCISDETLVCELMVGGAVPPETGGTWWSPEGVDSPSFRSRVRVAAALPVGASVRNKYSQKALEMYDWTRVAEIVDAAVQRRVHELRSTPTE